MTAEPEAAVAIVVAQGPEPSVLLIRRAERPPDSWSGHWSFPGGRKDPDDQDVIHTALRELDEECGVQLTRAHVIEALPNVVAMRPVRPFVVVAPVVFHVEDEVATMVDRREAVESVWVKLAELLDPFRHCLQPVPGRPREMLYPAIGLNHVPLWGFTYRLITQWLRLLPKMPALEQAGFETACRVLDFLTAHGLRVRRKWEERTAETEAAPKLIKAAEVDRLIPAGAVLEHFSRPGPQIPAVNCLEVRSEYVRVLGLALEEYLICAVPG